MIYDMIAPIYDAVNGEIDYKAWADFIESMIRKHYPNAPELVLDLGCGTGRMTLEMAKRGYDMTGVDYSPEMLDVARENLENEGLMDKTLLLCQDIRDFELYGTVDIALCCLDTMNHLTKPKDFKKCLSLVHNYLNPDGLFIFDLNGKYKFENIYGDRAYVIEEGNSVCIWQNYYNENSKICDFYVSVFKECEGLYEREDEIQRERMYTLRSVKEMLKNAGFELIGAYSDFEKTDATDMDERLYFVAKCIKKVNF